MRSISITQSQRDEVIWDNGRIGGTNSKSKSRAHDSEREATVYYEGHHPYELLEEWWHGWNIPLAEFNDVNLANVARITIGFGDGDTNGTGNVFFDNIVLTSQPLESDFSDPYSGLSVYLEEDPFVLGWMSYPLVIDQNSMLIDRGYGFVDEYRNIIGKTTSDDNSPDANRMDIGYHYFDWEYVNAGDSNSLSADLNNDFVVDFKDFAVLANGWKVMYDVNELGIMAGEWLCAAEPNIQLQIAGDGNDGYVEVRTTGHIGDTQRAFLLVDGQCVGEMSGLWDGWPFGMDVSKSGDGERQLKVVSIESDGNVTCSKVANVEFSCPLNYCLLPSHYEPNKPLCFSAFNASGGDVTVEVYADGEDLVWSQVYSGDSFFGSIPAEITNQYDFDYIRFDANSGGVELMGGSSGGGGAMKLSSACVPDPKEPPFDVRALIIVPEWDHRLQTSNVRRVVQTAFENRGIKCVPLVGYDACYELIYSYVQANNIEYMYIVAHGTHEFGDVLRTCVHLHEPIVSVKKSDGPQYSWCESLGRFWEKRAKSFASMEFNSLVYAQFDTCNSGRLTINANYKLVEGEKGDFYSLPLDELLISDMSIALGLHTDYFANRAYQGWYWSHDLRWPGESCVEEWTIDMWERLGAGDTVGQALQIAIGQQTNGDPCAPLKSFRFKGNGYIGNILVGN